ncbi:hypothetical protein SLE2022_325940 [Rubroshorea leprosula]
MATFRRSKDVPAGRCKPTMGCKKHPKHRQSPGVCSLCLREKLSHLSTSSSRRRPVFIWEGVVVHDRSWD